jgi:hypothetical protein
MSLSTTLGDVLVFAIVCLPPLKRASAEYDGWDIDDLDIALAG